VSEFIELRYTREELAAIQWEDDTGNDIPWIVRFETITRVAIERALGEGRDPEPSAPESPHYGPIEMPQEVERDASDNCHRCVHRDTACIDGVFEEPCRSCDAEDNFRADPEPSPSQAEEDVKALVRVIQEFLQVFPTQTTVFATLAEKYDLPAICDRWGVEIREVSNE
jgi:hypothetical protein